MKILFLSQYFFPEQFLNNHVARELVNEGHDVDVVCCVPNYPSGTFFEGFSNTLKRKEVWNGVAIYRALTVPRGKSAWQLVANYITYPLAASFTLLRIKPNNWDISFVSMPSPLFQAIAGLFAKRVWKIPTVYWVQDIWPDSAIVTLGIKNRFVRGLLNKVCGAIYRRADLIMVQSDGFHEKIARFGVDRARIVTLPNCAPPEFRPIAIHDVSKRIRRIVPSSPCTIMFAGNIGASQDFDTILDAVALLPDSIALQLVVLGSGRECERIMERVEVEGLGGRVVFLGRHPEADMPEFFACADALLVSLRDEEIFALTVPSKVQSYLACGKPIIGSIAGEGAQVIKASGAGYVAAPSSPKSLAVALEEFAELDPKERKELGANAIEFYRTSFSLSTITGSLLRNLSSVRSAAEIGRLP